MYFTALVGRVLTLQAKVVAAKRRARHPRLGCWRRVRPPLALAQSPLSVKEHDPSQQASLQQKSAPVKKTLAAEACLSATEFPGFLMAQQAGFIEAGVRQLANDPCTCIPWVTSHTSLLGRSRHVT